MNKTDFKIDSEKCIHCGLCAKDCITHCIELDDTNKIPRQKTDTNCIKCQHCLAVCPTGALSIFGKNPKDSDLKNEINPESILNLIKTRRSIRAYKPQNLDKERLNKLKEMLKWSPTGVNNHKLHFAFIDDIEVMDDFRNKVNPKLVKFLSNPVIKKIFPHFAGLKDAIEGGADIVFRGAPHMLVVSTPINSPCKNTDPTIALSYFELYAQSMGVGTLWCGFGEYCFKIFPDLSDYINVPDGYKVSYTMLFGIPDVEYKRSTQPEEFEISSVKIPDKNKSNSLIKNILRFVLNNFC